jgi:hypothetical protein
LLEEKEKLKEEKGTFQVEEINMQGICGKR